jgi:hypothetical protein
MREWYHQQWFLRFGVAVAPYALLVYAVAKLWQLAAGLARGL